MPWRRVGDLGSVCWLGLFQVVAFVSCRLAVVRWGPLSCPSPFPSPLGCKISPMNVGCPAYYSGLSLGGGSGGRFGLGFPRCSGRRVSVPPLVSRLRSGAQLFGRALRFFCYYVPPAGSLPGWPFGLAWGPFVPLFFCTSLALGVAGAVLPPCFHARCPPLL
jgi:hypothetical protein